MNTDTQNLLKECDAGIQMGIDSIEDVIGDIQDPKLRQILADSRGRHQILKDRADSLICCGEHKNPNPMAKAMSAIKTEVKMALDGSDATAADLITDGCHMGIKSLYRYINMYPAADVSARTLAVDTAIEEENLAREMRTYL